ncbi:MAG: ABC transporter ATP-binding protein [Acidimicrobiaceae bacterium]|nr:ABC transporter ATP-binding protein [Acidimicrobiaceae bacterium]
MSTSDAGGGNTAAAATGGNGAAPRLRVQGLTVGFDDFVAVSDVSFELHDGATLAVVGESGSGKSVTALSIMRLIEIGTRAEIRSGEVLFRHDDGSVDDLLQLPEPQMRSIRGDRISMIFQEPLTSLNPVYTVGSQIGEALRLHRGMNRSEARERTLEMLNRVRIPDAARRIDQYPHEMSGGMRQRVMIAMALACDPAILIADEPTTALDVTIQAQILALIAEMQRETGAAVLIITHDMGVVAEIADEVVVMQQSRLVERGQVSDIFERPSEPYTQSLLAAVPRLGSMAGVEAPQRFDLIDPDALAAAATPAMDSGGGADS